MPGLLSVAPESLAAQDPEDPIEVDYVSPQIWLDYNPSFPLQDDLVLYGDVGIRWELESAGWWRLVIRPGVRRCFENGVCLFGGLGSFYTANERLPDTWELRPFQGASATWPNWRILPLQHMLRLEERFDFNTQSWSSQASLRARYRIRTHFRWNALRADRYWQAFASLEGFATLLGNQGQFQESVRANLGLERSYGSTLRLRGEVTLQQRGLFFGSEESVNDLYIRFRVFHRWGS